MKKECLFYFNCIFFIFRNNTELATENYVDELKFQLMARDQTITMLQKELQDKSDQYHSIFDEISHTGKMVDSVRSKNRLFMLLR